jgi:DNA-binding response OmpR family regulator
MKALIVSTDSELQHTIGEALDTQHIELKTAATLSDALTSVTEDRYCVVISDERLADGRGVHLAQRLRQAEISSPIILLMREDSDEARINALDVGVDEILDWPTSPELLMAHVRSLVRRCAPGESAVLKFGDLTFDLRSLDVTREGQKIRLTSREMAILEFFLRHPRRLITRSELVESVWDSAAPPESNVVEVFIARLRNKIDKPFEANYIHTIVGRGYMLSESRPGTNLAPVETKAPVSSVANIEDKAAF